MATVYLAQDIKHDRKVAVKVLRPELAAVIGAERFLAEIKTTANLQHPHILPLHDSGEARDPGDPLGRPYLYYVMPFIEGESLRDRLTRDRQLPIDDAVRIAREIAGALDYAHRHSVIHRDIKPENILLHDGQALVADFGIALAVSSAGGGRMTETGMSLGTPHYMSPEQAMGEREISARSDVYALGCVLYEMLVGEPPFTGPTAQAIVARVMTEEPRSLTLQRKTIPPHVQAAVQVALAKLPADRFATAAEFAAALAGDGSQIRRYGATATAVPASAPAPAWYRRTTLVATLALLVGAGLTALALRGRAGAPTAVRASLLPPPGCRYGGLGISNLVRLSPDGSRLAFVASCEGGSSLWIRELASGTQQRLEGTANALYPFWSPDGASLGFFSDGQLRRIDLASGAVRTIAPAPNGRGGAWSPTETIVFAPDIFGPLQRVPATGGRPEPATALTDTSRSVSHRNPCLLPDGKHFLFIEGGPSGEGGTTRVGQLGSTASRPLLETASNVVYAEGRLLYVRDGVLMAQPFDPGNARLSGTAEAIVPALETWKPKYLGNFTAVGGTLIYREPPLDRSRILWFDPRTRSQTIIQPDGNFGDAALSPDGRRLLVARSPGESPLSDLWLYELSADAWVRMTDAPSRTYHFDWFPDGRRFFYYADPSTLPARIVTWSDRRVVDSVPRPDANFYPIQAVAPSGSYALGARQVVSTGMDIMRLPLQGADRGSQPLLASPADEDFPHVSPDGRLVAYASTRSGRWEVMVAELPDARVEWQVSQDGALFSSEHGIAWSRDGRTLYYVDGEGRLASAALSPGAGVHFGPPAVVPGAPADLLSVDTGPDGRLVLVVATASREVPLTILTQWRALAGEGR